MADYPSNVNDGASFDALMAKLNNLTVIDNLASTDTSNPLSAKQGSILLSYLISGWIPVTVTFTLSSADSPIFVLGTSIDLSGVIKVKDRIKLTQSGATIYAIVVAITSTTITLQVESGKAIVNTTSYPISSIYYSHISNPIGFPTSNSKWMVSYSISANTARANPTVGAVYSFIDAQGNAVKLDLPIGRWRVKAKCAVAAAGTASTFYGAKVSLSASATAHDASSVYHFLTGGSGITQITDTVLINETIEVAVKTPLYLVGSVTNGAPSDLVLLGANSRATTIEAISDYL